MTLIYKNPVIQRVLDYYGPLLFEYPKNLTIKKRLNTLATHLWRAVVDDNNAVLTEINNYHPDFISKSWKEIKSKGFLIEDAFVTIARQYGYEHWDTIPDTALDVNFERAVDLLLAGALQQLQDMIIEDKSILTRRSSYGHEASLLHYTGNNGVELYRQVLPYNLPQMLELLIRSGADVHAKMKVYGGEYIMIDLLNSSAHPFDSGLHSALLDVYGRFAS